MKNEKVIYWAGPLFTQAERTWNRLCAHALISMGYNVILPQDEANKFITDGKVDFQSLAEDCRRHSCESTYMVAILDGSDTDSGTSLEIGLRLANNRPVIGVRTDFRQAEDGCLNGMFRLITRVVYFPSFNESHEELCILIDEAIRSVGAMEASFCDLKQLVKNDPLL